MIKGFADRETEKVFHGQHSRKVPVDVQRRAKMRLDRIDAANDINDLRVPPSHHLEKLSSNRAGQYSILINQQWRVCFIWENSNAHAVEMVDYH